MEPEKEELPTEEEPNLEEENPSEEKEDLDKQEETQEVQEDTGKTKTNPTKMSLTDATRPIKTIPFTGKKEDFFLWSARFLAYCTCNKCKKILLGEQQVPTDAEYAALATTDPTYDEKVEIKKSNDLAIILLTMSMNDAVSYAAIHNSITSAYKDGNATVAWKNLNNVFKPKSSAQKHELEQQFNHCVLANEDQSPEEWFAKLERIKIQLRVDFATEYDDEKMKSHILYNIQPKYYETIVTVMKRDLNRDPNCITLDQMKEEIRQIYGTLKTGMKSNRPKPYDNVLMATTNPRGNFKKKIKTDCYVCGKKGHKGADCWENPRNASKRPKTFKSKNENAQIMTPTGSNKSRVCTHCKKTGHTVDYCWIKNKENKTKLHGELAAPAVAYEFNEYANIHCVKDAQHQTSLYLGGAHKINKDTFIADSGATCHMRYSTEGMTNLKQCKAKVTVGNSAIMKSTAMGDFEGIALQDDGQAIHITLKDVLLVPEI